MTSSQRGYATSSQCATYSLTTLNFKHEARDSYHQHLADRRGALRRSAGHLGACWQFHAWSSWMVLALLPTVAPAALEVELRGGQEFATAEVVAKRLSRSASAESASAVRVVTKTSSATLEPGEWTVTAEVPGYWSTSEELTVEDQGDQEVALHLWPSGTLEGRVRGPADTELPAALDLVWSPSPGGEKGLPSASTVCPVTDGRWRCELPAGRLDLFLGAAGYIHQHRWEVPVRAGELARMRDAIVLRRGSAIRGWVTTEDDRGVGGAKIEVAPRIAGRGDI